MKREQIQYLIREGLLRKKSVDISRIKSLLEASQENVLVVLKIPINEKSSTMIFRELYESIRQIGDAKWLSLGYEPRSHELSMNILTEEDIKNRMQLQRLNRFREIRHDANYRGYKITKNQANEIVEFWKSCGEELIRKIRELIKERTSSKKFKS